MIITPFELLESFFIEIKNMMMTQDRNKLIFYDEKSSDSKFDFCNEIDYDHIGHYYFSNKIFINHPRPFYNKKFIKEIGEYLNSISSVSEEDLNYTGMHLSFGGFELDIQKMIDAGFLRVPEYNRQVQYSVYLEKDKLNYNEYFKYYLNKPDTYSYALYHHFGTILEITNNIKMSKNLESIKGLFISILHGKYPINFITIRDIFEDFIIPYSDEIEGISEEGDDINVKMNYTIR